MRFSLSLAAAASMLGLAQARIVGISVPDTIRPGDGFNAIVISENYIQRVYDVAIVFGYVPGNGYPQSLGYDVESFYIGPGQSNQLKSFKKWITIPDSVPKGKGVVAASLMSLYGVLHSPTLSNYQVNVTFGEETSTHYISSLQ
ncbi:hypothetical protein HIM_09673 [Hirsutella minnesotensis 3608]|uniref:Uncharacterized protein n=1 Tax=Hirsutella minnesotensis 3608 TaxID=1043627 RepID=A0A0F7ZXL3_9HYPO|nr:hypothetical protein HIM_09673 [Hirsutella minnesotensis 3608]